MANQELAIEACNLLRDYLEGVEAVDDVELATYRKLIRDASRESIFFFARHVLGFDKLTEETHGRWGEDLQETFWLFSYFMRLKPRETYKTTFYGEAFILWLWAVVSPELRIFYTSANDTLLSEVSGHLNRFLSYGNDSLYTLVFGIQRDPSADTNTKDVFNIIGRDRNAKGSSLMFRTVGGSTNGIHPHIVIVDDPMDLKDRESHATRVSKERWFESLFFLLTTYNFHHGDDIIPIEKIMVISTRWHMNDLVQHIIDQNEQKLLGDEKFHVEVEGVYKPDGSLQYPEIWSEERIRKRKSNMSEVFFSCQLLNNPLPEGMAIFKEDDLHFADPVTIDLTRGLNYCFLDPSRGKKRSAFPAVWFVNRQEINGEMRNYFFDAIDVKQKLGDLLKQMARMCKDYNVVTLQWENNGTMILDKAIDDIFKEIGYRINIEERSETRHKETRIDMMQPLLTRGDAIFMSDWKARYPEAMNQILFYPSWGFIDFPDLVEAALDFLENEFKYTHIGRHGRS